MEPKEVWEYIKVFVEVVMVPFCLYVLKEIKDGNKKTDEVGKLVNQVNTTLVGQDGKNGLRSRFNKMERKVENLALAMARHGIVPRDTPEADDE